MRLSAQTVTASCGGNSNLHETLGCTGVIKSPFPAGHSQGMVCIFNAETARRRNESLSLSLSLVLSLQLRRGASSLPCPCLSKLSFRPPSYTLALSALAKPASQPASPWINATFTVLDVASPTTTVIPRVTGRL